MKYDVSLGAWVFEPYYSDHKKQWEDHRDYFVKATPSKEKRMNTYYITATASFRCEYEVEATTKEDAINEVEYGNVEPTSTEFDGEVQDIEVVDVEYGDVEYSSEVTAGFVVRGVEDHGVIKDALAVLFEQFEGKTAVCDTGELELVSFDVKSVSEE